VAEGDAADDTDAEVATKSKEEYRTCGKKNIYCLNVSIIK
jgi:hypothetical protein